MTDRLAKTMATCPSGKRAVADQTVALDLDRLMGVLEDCARSRGDQGSELLISMLRQPTRRESALRKLRALLRSDEGSAGRAGAFAATRACIGELCVLLSAAGHDINDLVLDVLTIFLKLGEQNDMEDVRAAGGVQALTALSKKSNGPTSDKATAILGAHFHQSVSLPSGPSAAVEAVATKARDDRSVLEEQNKQIQVRLRLLRAACVCIVCRQVCAFYISV